MKETFEVMFWRLGIGLFAEFTSPLIPQKLRMISHFRVTVVEMFELPTYHDQYISKAK